MARKPAPTPALKLEGDLDVFSVQVQWERLQPLLTQEGGTARLDLSDLGDLDLSGVQLLCALDRDIRAHGQDVEMSGVKEEWVARFAPLGLASVFTGGAS